MVEMTNIFKNKDSIIFIFESTSVIRRIPFYLQTYER